MSLIDKIRVWATSGTKTKPADTKIDTGWIGGEQPPHEWENERQNKRDTIINQLVDEVNRGSSGSTKLFHNLSAGVIKDIMAPWDDDNTFNFGNGFDWDACLYSYEGTQLLMVMHQPSPSSNWRLYGVDIDDLSLTVYRVMTSDYTHYGMACDGQWLYLLGDQTSASYRRYQVFAKDPILWTDKPGFGYNQLGNIAPLDKDSHVIIQVLKSGNLFLAGKWDDLGDKKFHIVDEDSGNIIRSGNGGLSSDQYPTGNAVEAGGNIWFTVKSRTGSSQYISAVKEIDLTVTASGVTGIPFNQGNQIADSWLHLASMGTTFVLTRQADFNQPTWQVFMGNSDFSTTPLSGYQWNDTNARVGPSFYDGHNLWMTLYDPTGALSPRNIAIKFNPASSIPPSVGLLDLSGVVGQAEIFTLDNALTDTAIGAMRPPLVFDGASVWCGPYQLGGGGEWRRVIDSFNR